MSKHSAGPWEVRTAGHGSKSGDFTVDEFYVWTAAHDDIALCADVVDAMGHPSEANARLIAAAPELLEALESILWAEDEQPSHREDAIRHARAAFAKATGDQA